LVNLFVLIILYGLVYEIKDSDTYR